MNAPLQNIHLGNIYEYVNGRVHCKHEVVNPRQNLRPGRPVQQCSMKKNLVIKDKDALRRFFLRASQTHLVC